MSLTNGTLFDMDTQLILAVTASSVLTIVFVYVLLQRLNKDEAVSSDDIRTQIAIVANQEFGRITQALNASTEERLRTTQESIANQNAVSHRAMTELVNPLNDALKTLNTYVKEVETTREGAYKGLVEQVANTQNLLNTLQADTQNLNKTLSSSQTRGNWGELQLHKIVEHVGLADYYSFDEQKQGEGTGRPDSTIKLPGGKVLYIDSKFPLSAYQDAVHATDDATRAAKLKEHAETVKGHIDKLAKRDYDLDASALDVVVMFMPIEACLQAAAEFNRDLYDYAASKKIVLAGPSSLVAILTNFSTTWRQYDQWKNADEIVNQAKIMHGSLMTFIDHFGKLRKSIDSVVSNFDSAVGSLDRNIVPKAREIEKLGRLKDSIPNIESIGREARISKYESSGDDISDVS